MAVLLWTLTEGVRAQSPSSGDAPASDVPVAVEEGRQETVVEIRVQGNRRVEAEAVKRALRNKQGRPFDRSKTAEELRSLWSMGFFSDIELFVQRLPKGGVAYVVRVKERPAVREVKLEGNSEISTEDLKESVDVKPFAILDLERVRRNEKKILEKYVEKGFFLAEVTHRIDAVAETAEVDVVFVIRENAKVMVKEIRLLGAQQVPPAELKAAMATKEGNYLSFLTSDGTFRDELLQRDLAMIQAAYYDKGFINVKVDKPQVSISADKKFLFISLSIVEGEQYAIGKLDFSGDLMKEKAELDALMSSRSGQLFNRTQLSKDIQALTDLYFDEGYAYANVTPLTNIRPENKTIDLTFDIQQGKRVSIERIEIVGNTKTRDAVIRRELRVYEGELFSGSQMRRSRDRVTALGFFESVDITHKPGQDDSKVVLQVDIKEKATGTFQVGMGFSNVENFIFTAQISQNNALGWGTSVSASAQLSSLRSFAQVSYFDPHFLDSNYILSADFFKMQADFFGFIRDSTGGNLSLGYQLGSLSTALEDVMVNLTYTQEHVRVEPGRNFNQSIPLANQFRDGVTSSLRLSGTWDKRNNRLFPSSGFMLFGSVEYAPELLGGSFLFTRYSGYGRFYIPLPLGFVFKTNATFGVIDQLRSDSPLPISELYFAGGINTLRGYALRTVSPTVLVGNSTEPDALLRPFGVGGNKQALFNIELEFPLFQQVGIRGVIFYDMGNTYPASARFFQDPNYDLPLGMLHSFGWGFRWFSPIGPLRFEWGVPLNPRPGDQSILFEFTIGNFF